MIEGIGTILIARPPQAIADFVTDLESYKLADWKIGRVLHQERSDEKIIMRHDGRLRGLPGPAVKLELTRVDPHTIRYRSLTSFPSRFVLRFEGGFDFRLTPDGTEVTHTERFHFYWPWKWLAEPFLRDWLAQDVQAEMQRMKAILEGSVSVRRC